MLYVTWLNVGTKKTPGSANIAYTTEDIRVRIGQVRAVSFAHAKQKARQSFPQLQGETRSITATIVDEWRPGRIIEENKR